MGSAATLPAYEGSVRLGVFVVLLVLFGVVESRRRRRQLVHSRLLRWSGNLGLSLVNILALRLLFPLLAIGMADYSGQRGWGLFNTLEAPFLLSFVVSFVVLDLVLYAQHVLFHALPPLWRVHRVHHSDVDVDVSSAVRFHLLESVLSMGIKIGAVLVLGAPVLVVLFFEVWLSAVTMFHHSELGIPAKLDRWLRWLVVTPDMHRVHHSVRVEETNSNYSFNLPWWDRIFRTYCPQPRDGHVDMALGVESFRTAREQRLDRLLLQPFLSRSAASPATPLVDG